MDIERLRTFARDAQAMIDRGDVEDRLRHYLSTCLPSIFPDSPWWVQAHALGAEEHVRFTAERGVERRGFVDTVIGKTAVEYEKNLMLRPVFEEGYHQVKEYCAALRNMNIPENEILGVLSDTVRWHGYTVRITGMPNPIYGADNVELTEVAHVDLSTGTEEEFLRFDAFVERFFNRDQSRLLSALTLSTDYGVDSRFYQEHIGSIENIVSRAMTEKPDYADLIKQVWQNFVAYLDATDYGNFSLDTYVNEFYLVTVAKVLCANILAGAPVISDPTQIKQIMSGAYFTGRSITNFVDYDYFGWLNFDPYVNEFVDFVSDMQRNMSAYDFSHISDEDLFGKLLAELANREHRLMLGQEFTPHWVAHEMVDHVISGLGQRTPQALDMCCGSGVFLIETIKTTRSKYHITPDDYSPEKDAIVFTCATGFDIDPLAVMLAKVNWVIAMQDLFRVHHGDITVPVYHADSLFVDTPIVHRQLDAQDGSYTFRFDHNEVTLPGVLFTADNKRLFDTFMAKVYRISMARAGMEQPQPLTNDLAEGFMAAIENESEAVLQPDEHTRLVSSIVQLIDELENLQRQGRNGIWYFILCNSYRPSLMRHQFNCIISNPPWMAMSKLANNPYRRALQRMAEKYDIKPTGASHPHMELATIFLLSAVDRYLGNDSLWSCIMPGSLLGGFQHNKLRLEAYRTSVAALPMDIASIWELPLTVFKNKAIVLSGAKVDQYTPRNEYSGRVYDDHQAFTECVYRRIQQGERTAWTNNGEDTLFIEAIGGGGLSFEQGADLLPRTALFHEASVQPNGNWTLRPIKQTSDLWYLMSDNKIWPCRDLSAENVSAEFMYDAYISKHISPFFVSSPAKVIVPGKRENGRWKALPGEERALVNAGTESVFTQIEAGMMLHLSDFFVKKVNMRNKLGRQDFSLGDWLVLSNAGGSNPCAAYISLEGTDRTRIIVDQTLYWYLARSEEEALYITGLINSKALSEIIREFQPEGGFGPRHIHTLPYKMISPFNEDDPVHAEIVEKTRALANEWHALCENPDVGRNLNPNCGSLNSRRRSQQTAIRLLPCYSAYEAACRALFE